MNLWLTIPCYRDAERLSHFLPRLCACLQELPGIGIQVVDDGSGAVEARRVEEAIRAVDDEKKILHPPLILEKNRGKGGAVYASWNVAPEAEWLGFVDADGAVPPEEVARLTELTVRGELPTDALLASRVKMLGRRVDRSMKRHVVGRVFATLASAAIGLEAYDTQCGLKLVRRSAYLAVRSRLSECRFAFDVDLLAQLAKQGVRMREVPVDWSDVPGSKVSLVRDSFQMANAVWRLRRTIR
ncbi:MAG TPA: glycosyltransferase [Chthoniobacterales bacterium]|jgi:dolichyl-phosphate beta-glucosyltransferase